MDDESEFGEEASDDDIGKQEEKQQWEQTEVEKRDAEADAVLEEALKQGKYEDTIKECKKALELNLNYMKALIRRAGAYEKLEHFEEAIAVLIYLGLAELLCLQY
ncbi:hypothetical protein QQ045_009028 [Rhodiola kirilowii]